MLWLFLAIGFAIAAAVVIIVLIGAAAALGGLHRPKAGGKWWHVYTCWGLGSTRSLDPAAADEEPRPHRSRGRKNWTRTATGTMVVENSSSRLFAGRGSPRSLPLSSQLTGESPREGRRSQHRKEYAIGGTYSPSVVSSSPASSSYSSATAFLLRGGDDDEPV